jgi:hypothetical protein
MWGQTSCCHSLVSQIQEPLVQEEAVEVAVGAETVVVEVAVGEDEEVARRWAVVDEEVADDHSVEAEEVARRWAVVDEDEAASRSSAHINQHTLCCR